MDIEIADLYNKLKANQKVKRQEDTLQQRCVRHWQTKFRPDSDEYYLLYKVHNEGKKTKQQAAKDKAMGIVSGAADLNLDLARHGFHGLRIELKSLVGSQSANQKRVEQALQKNGYLYKVIRDFNEFVTLINWYLGHE